jgi:hypothetical protein
MLIILDDLGAQYTKIRGDAARAGGGCSVLLLVAPDCDSLCAARILTTLFKGDSLEFKMVGVAGYTDVQNEVNAAMAPTGGASASAAGSLTSSPLRSVIMINCGAVPKIDELLELPAGVTLYIIDSHRPIYHTNVRADGRIRVLTSMTRDALAIDTVPEAGDSDLEAEDEEEDDEDGSEGSDDSDSEGSEGSDADEADEEDAGSDRSSESGEGSDEAAEEGAAAAAAAKDADAGEGVGAGESSSEAGGADEVATGAGGAAAAGADEAGGAAAAGGAAKRSRAEAAAASKEAARRKRKLRKAADAASAGASSSDGDDGGEGDEGADADFTDGADAGARAGAKVHRKRGGKAKRASGGAAKGAKRRRTTGGDGDDDDGRDGSDSEAGGAAAGGAGGGGKQQVDLQRLYRDMRRRRKRRHADYYGQGHHHAFPASYVALCLAQALNRVRNDMLWLAIVGLTDVSEVCARIRCCCGRSMPLQMRGVAALSTFTHTASRAPLASLTFRVSVCAYPPPPRAGLPVGASGCGGVRAAARRSVRHRGRPQPRGGEPEAARCRSVRRRRRCGGRRGRLPAVRPRRCVRSGRCWRLRAGVRWLEKRRGLQRAKMGWRGAGACVRAVVWLCCAAFAAQRSRSRFRAAQHCSAPAPCTAPQPAGSRALPALALRTVPPRHRTPPSCITSHCTLHFTSPPTPHAGAGGGAGATGWEDTSGKGNAGVRGFIAPSVEPRFVSHRFSSLYEAMFHSEYVSTRLETWRVEGGTLKSIADLWRQNMCRPVAPSRVPPLPIAHCRLCRDASRPLPPSPLLRR